MEFLVRTVDPALKAHVFFSERLERGESGLAYLLLSS